MCGGVRREVKRSTLEAALAAMRQGWMSTGLRPVRTTQSANVGARTAFDVPQRATTQHHARSDNHEQET